MGHFLAKQQKILINLNIFILNCCLKTMFSLKINIHMIGVLSVTKQIKIQLH